MKPISPVLFYTWVEYKPIWINISDKNMNFPFLIFFHCSYIVVGKENILFGIFLISIPNNNFGQSYGWIEAQVIC